MLRRWRRSRWRWRRVTSHLFSAAVSISLALVIWFLVTDSQLETVEERLGFGLAVDFVNTPNDLAPANRLPTASITIAGSESNVRSVVADDFVVTVDLAGLIAGSHNVPVRVRSLADGVRVRSVAPVSIEVLLEPVEQRTFPVTVLPANPPPLGFKVGDPDISMETVTVSGISQLVDLVDVVVAAIDLEGTTVGIEATTVLQARTATGAAVSGVQINPATVEVSVPVEQVTFRRSVAVNPQLSSRPRTGFRITGIEIDPLNVVVVGTLEALENVETVETEPISVAAREESFSSFVDLVLPPGLALEAEVSVTVLIKIDSIKTKAVFLLPVDAIGLGDGLSADIKPQFVTAQLTGSSMAIAEIAEMSSSAVIDLTQLTPGTHALFVDFNVEDDVSLVLQPDEVMVVIVEKDDGGRQGD